MKRESARVAISAEDLINSCLKQGELFGLSRASMYEAMSMLLAQDSVPSHVSTTPTFTHDKTKDGWKLLENVSEVKDINIKDLHLVSFLRNGESYINGEEMVRRSNDLKANLGQQHAEYLLAHQNEIPKEFRKYCLVFTGTVWLLPGGSRCVACLFWGGVRWYLSFGWLGDGWFDDGRLLSARK